MLANLKAALAARRVRQFDLALMLKISPSVLSEIINGRRQPNPSLRARIAEALHADERWLFSYITRIPGPTKSSARGHS
jgi:transcriptional regulator with XRE-family HTH domain